MDLSCQDHHFKYQYVLRPWKFGTREKCCVSFFFLSIWDKERNYLKYNFFKITVKITAFLDFNKNAFQSKAATCIIVHLIWKSHHEIILNFISPWPSHWPWHDLHPIGAIKAFQSKYMNKLDHIKLGGR